MESAPWRREKLYLDIKKLINSECLRTERSKMISRRQVLSSEREMKSKADLKKSSNFKVKQNATSDNVQKDPRQIISIKNLVLDTERSEVLPRLNSWFSKMKSSYFRKRTLGSEFRKSNVLKKRVERQQNIVQL